MSTDKKGTKILARTFFAQMKSAGYTRNQILEVASEILELVTCDVRESSRPEVVNEEDVQTVSVNV